MASGWPSASYVVVGAAVGEGDGGGAALVVVGEVGGAAQGVGGGQDAVLGVADGAGGGAGGVGLRDYLMAVVDLVGGGLALGVVVRLVRRPVRGPARPR